MTKPSNIILTTDHVQPVLQQLRKRGQRIVLTQGVFDLVHIGHARYCQVAKEYGDVLIVGVDSDEKVRKRKGPDRPVVPEDERLEMLTYLRSVDYVVLKDLSERKWDLIKKVKPDVLVATKETYTSDQISQLQQWCGRVVVLDPMATTSTSAKIRRLQIGMAKQIAESMGKRLIATIEETLTELLQAKP